MKKCSKCENDNDNTSTIAYSDDKSASNESSTFTGDRELVDILDKLTQISEQMIEEISTGYSMDDYIHLLNNGNNVEKDNCENNAESAESDSHDINSCSCHVPQHLQYAV